MLGFVLSCILFYFISIPLKPVCFLMRDIKGVDLDGRGGGGAAKSRGSGNHNQDILCEEKEIYNRNFKKIEKIMPESKAFSK